MTKLDKIPPVAGTDPLSFTPRVRSLLGSPVALRPVDRSARLRSFTPAEFVARVPFGADTTRAAGEVEIGVWNAISTDAGELFFVTVDGQARRMLISTANAETGGMCGADEAGRITLFDGDDASAEAVARKDGTARFTAKGRAPLDCARADDPDVPRTLVRRLPLADRALLDRGLHTAIAAVSLRAPDPGPIAIAIPLAIVLCCVRLKIAYDKDGWSGEGEFNCTCLDGDDD